jgi:hypothetical protein
MRRILILAGYLAGMAVVGFFLIPRFVGHRASRGTPTPIAATATATPLPTVAAAEMADSVILDPPRAGCAGRVTGWLALAGPERVVYVSCDPATLARDLHVLVASGPYRVDAIDIVDMFAQTYHVESVVTLVREESR